MQVGNLGCLFLRSHFLASFAAATDFKGSVGDKYRILLASCDLFGEDGTDEPWKDGLKLTPDMAMESIASAMLKSTAHGRLLLRRGALGRET